jgi:hypothetical protein
LYYLVSSGNQNASNNQSGNTIANNYTNYSNNANYQKNYGTTATCADVSESTVVAKCGGNGDGGGTVTAVKLELR